MNPGVYLKTFSRERSLIHNQMWYYGEASGPRRWTSQIQPYLPYIVFHRTNKLVDVYMDQRGVEWVKAEILDMVKSDPQRVRDEASQYLAYVRSKNEDMRAAPTLDLPDLVRYADGMRDTWAYQEIGWWGVEVLEDKPEYAEELEFLLDIRRKTEKDTPTCEKVLVQSLMKAFSLDEHRARVVSYEEAKGGVRPNDELLDSRLQGYFYTADTLFSGGAQSEIEQKFNIQLERPADTSVSSVQGTVASPGIARGRVRKVLNENDMQGFQEGDILVATSTIPPFLPVMKKAAGIVADEGGMISHTAIAARELKKPCIIGTRIATQVFNDGDMVEVDANKGIVRRLSI